MRAAELLSVGPQDINSVADLIQLHAFARSQLHPYFGARPAVARDVYVLLANRPLNPPFRSDVVRSGLATSAAERPQPVPVSEPQPADGRMAWRPPLDSGEPWDWGPPHPSPDWLATIWEVCDFCRPIGSESGRHLSPTAQLAAMPSEEIDECVARLAFACRPPILTPQAVLSNLIDAVWEATGHIPDGDARVLVTIPPRPPRSLDPADRLDQTLDSLSNWFREVERLYPQVWGEAVQALRPRPSTAGWNHETSNERAEVAVETVQHVREPPTGQRASPAQSPKGLAKRLDLQQNRRRLVELLEDGPQTDLRVRLHLGYGNDKRDSENLRKLVTRTNDDLAVATGSDAGWAVITPDNSPVYRLHKAVSQVMNMG